MSEPRVQYVGERNPSITDTLTSGGVAIDLTGSTVKFKMRAVGSSTFKVDAAATIVSAPAGTVRYDWQSADVDTAGFYLGFWEISTGGKLQAKPEFLLEFRAHGPTAGWLVELAEVRQAKQLKEKVDEWDDRIMQLLPIVTERIHMEIDREIVPKTDDLVRSFAVCGRIIDLRPYDLRNADSVVLDPTGVNKTLVAGTDYKLLPIGKDRWGVYTEIELSSYLAITESKGFSEVELRVTGDWGFPTVPGIAKEACFDTIRAWMQTSALRGAYTDPDMPSGAPDPATFYSLPPAVRNTLRPLYRGGLV